jgi:2Fe-2S ferredoxin
MMNSYSTIKKEPSSNMDSRHKDIHVKVLLGDEEYMLETYTNEYRNLMMLLYDKMYIEDFGECKGMGRCGTCVVEILESTNNMSCTVRNEEATLKKTGVANTSIRLSCQILLNDDLKNAIIRIC